MVNWKEIHEEFSNLLQGKKWKKSWQENGFAYEEVKKWIEVGVKPNEANYAAGWKKQNFSFQQAKEWIKVGLKPWEAAFALYLIKQGHTVESVPGYIEILRKEYRKHWTDIHFEFENSSYGNKKTYQ